MKYKSMIISFVAAAGIIMLYAGLASSGPVHIRIKSVYPDQVNHKPADHVIWNFLRTDKNFIEVSRETDKNIIARLKYDDNGRLIRVEEKNADKGNSFAVFDHSKSGIVLSDGSPVPYDDLGSYNNLSPEAVMKKSAGGVKFSILFTRTIKDVDIGFVEKENMIDPDLLKQFKDSRFKLIIVKRNGELMAKQLWAENFSWWIYEETPFRKSWLIP